MRPFCFNCLWYRHPEGTPNYGECIRYPAKNTIHPCVCGNDTCGEWAIKRQ